MKVKFNLSRGFKLVPEGEQVLTITEINAVPSGLPKQVKITWTDATGTNLLETCDLATTIWKLSRICEVAFGIKDGEEMELDEIISGLKGKQFECEIVHTQGKNPREDGTYPTYANIKNILSRVELTDNVLPENMTQTTNPRDSILSGL